MTEVGARVWAMRETTADTIYAYGLGTYLGDEPLPGWDHPDMLARAERAIRNSDARPLIDSAAYFGAKVERGEMTRAEADTAIAEVAARSAAEQARPMADRARDLARACGANPKIRLDAGGYVWGAECWWGEVPDDEVPQGWVKGRRIVIVPPPIRSPA